MKKIKPDFKTEGVKLYKGDCLEVMSKLKPNLVDMVLCDPPYGTTQNKWDTVVDLEKLWPLIWSNCKNLNTPVVMTCQTPFDKALGYSQIDFLKYEWLWQKPKATGHLNCKRQPLKEHENVLVFYKKPPVYNPQMSKGETYTPSGGVSKMDNYGSFGVKRENNGQLRYPRSIQKFKHVVKPIHPTQKPVELMEYLIKTYTNEGDTVLDFTMGSGTTGVACVNTGRKFIGIELDDPKRGSEFFDIAVDRIQKAILKKQGFSDAVLNL